MNPDNDRTSASGLLHELDDIRSLLDEALPDDAIPVLEDAVEIVEPAAAPAEATGPLDLETALDPEELEHIPLLQDAIPDVLEEEAFDESFDQAFDDESLADDIVPEAITFEPVRDPAAPTPGATPFPTGATVTELLAAQELQTAIRNRVDATFDHWLNDTLQGELNLLRARLLEAVRAEVHEFVTQQINRDNATGRPHGE
jgi:hypothetical protein